MTLDPLSRVIHTQALSALKPLRDAKMDDPKPARVAALRVHRSNASTLASTIDAADAGGLSEQQKLAVNLGKLTSLFSRRISMALQKGRPTEPTVPAPPPTVTRKRKPIAPAPPAPEPQKKIKEEPLDEEDDQPGCSTAATQSANETLSSLLDAQLRSVRAESAAVRRPQPPPTVPRPVTTVVRAAAGSEGPVKVVVANRNGAAARVVAVRRPNGTVPPHAATVTAQRPTATAVVVAADRATVPPRPGPTTKVTAARPSIATKGLLPPIGRPSPQPNTEANVAILMSLKHLAEEAHLCKRLRIHKDAAYGCCEVDKPEMHPPNACPYCGLVIEGASRIEHVKETHPDRYTEFTPFLCILKECDYRTTSRTAVWRHSMQVHSPLYDKWEAQGRLNFDAGTVCPLCDDAFPVKSLGQLRMHARAKHEMMPTILCESCCETCTSTSELFHHWVHSPFCDGKAKLLDCREESFLALFT